MSVEASVLNSCLLCGSQALAEAISLLPTPLEDHFTPENTVIEPQVPVPLRVCRCETCGHAQLSHIVPPEFIYQHALYQSLTSNAMIQYFEEAASLMSAAAQLQADSLVVDVGCNEGASVQCYAQQGKRVVGVEPSAAALASQEIAIYHDFFTPAIANKIVSTHGKATLITVNNVLTNVDKLSDFLQAVKIALSENGVCAIETLYWKINLEHGIFDYIYHEHVNYFLIKPLEAFFKKNNLQLYDVDDRAMKEGSVRLLLQHAHGSRVVSPRVSQYIAVEESLNLFSSTVYTRFYEKLVKAKKQCQILLRALNIPKEKMAGYGAARCGTMLLCWYEIADYLSFLVDENPVKHNTLSPGHHLPVFSPSALVEKSVKYVLILPWRFSNAIVEKNKLFTEHGGCFIEVYPEPKIVEALVYAKM